MYTDDIALTLQPRVGARTAAHLVNIFGSARRVFESSVDELRERAELNPEIASELLKKRFHNQAEEEQRNCRKEGIEILPYNSEKYPALLGECDDRPHVLYIKGEMPLPGERMLSVVGTRKITGYGQKSCSRIISQLADLDSRLTIVSGLAYGVDSAAHRSNLENNLRTIAVLPVALPRIYPAAHRSLATQIVSNGGALISEYPPGWNAGGYAFIPRNRIIAGMTPGTVVVESPPEGGSMVTAGIAAGYNRSVMAVPGRISDEASQGCNKLIKNQIAVMTTYGYDIANELGWEIPNTDKESGKPEVPVSAGAERILSLLPQGEVIAIEELFLKAGIPAAEIYPLILELEMADRLVTLPGKRVEKL